MRIIIVYKWLINKKKYLSGYCKNILLIFCFYKLLLQP